MDGVLDVEDVSGTCDVEDSFGDGLECDAAELLSAISFKHLSVSVDSCFNHSAIVVSIFLEGSNISVALPLPL